MEALRAALATARRIGATVGEGYTLHNLGLALARMGRLEEGVATEDAAAAVASRSGEQRLVLACHAYRCQMLLEAGRAAEALASIEPAALAPPELRGHMDSCLGALRASALVACGRGAVARAEAERALALRAAAGGMEENEAELFLAAHDAGIEGALAEGARALSARAAAISDASLRESFLERVPPHRRLVALARDAGLWPAA